MSFRVTLPCSRAQAEALSDADAFADAAEPPVLVADEPDPAKPDDWLIHAYFERHPTLDDIGVLVSLGRGAPVLEHTPTHPPDPDAINFEIDASLAFGTGQHATTAGCLEALDLLANNGSLFANVVDVGTGTGLLAFAAMSLWPQAKCIATDIDPVAVEVARDNAAINHVKIGHGAGELLLGVADGMDSALLAARAPFDLIIANILAGPLIELAPDFAKALTPGGTIILAGLLDTQADAVVAAYEKLGLVLRERGFGEWPVLVCELPG
jgi:ribosomal protein L11 methyltransferase